MKDRPILFSAPMVRALLDGSKTQTRRVVKPQPERRSIADVGSMLGFKKRHGEGFWLWPNAKDRIIAECPFGQSGDRLWVRESLSYDAEYGHYYVASRPRVYLCSRFDNKEEETGYSYEMDMACRAIPSIHLPRKYSRITLEIIDVRVERLQDISEADALADGIKQYRGALRWVRYLDAMTGEAIHNTARDAYRALWESINGPGSWDANPWVWVVEFKQLNAAGAPA